MNKILLLDLGNVLIKVDFTPFLGWLAERSGKEPEKIRAITTSSLFYDFEFGGISRAEFARRVGLLYGAPISLQEVEEHFCGIFPGLVEGMEDFVSELAEEGPVFCLTNTNEIHLEHCRARFPVLEKFTKIFASHEIHKRKPYPGIYRDVARAIEAEPSNILFFDDVHANVQGALRAGLDAHLFVDSLGAREVLKAQKETADRALGESI